MTRMLQTGCFRKASLHLQYNSHYGDNTLKWTKQFQEETMGKGQGDGLIGEKTLAKASKVKK